MDRTKLKPKEHHGSGPSTAATQAQQSPPPPKLIYGTSIDYQERAKRLRLTGPPPDHDLNPFNAPTVNKIESMFERVMSIAKSSSSSSSASQPARRHGLFAPPPSSLSSTRNTYERHQTKPEEKDTIASTFTHPPHEQPRQSAFSLSSSSRSYIPVPTATSEGYHRYSRPPIPSVWSSLSTEATTSEADEKANRYRYILPPMDAATTTLTRPTATNRPTLEEVQQQQQQQQQQKQEPVYQQPLRAPMNTQAAMVPPSVPMKRPLSPEPPASEVVDADSDDLVEILSSDEEEGEQELSAEDEEHYSYSDEDEQEEEEELEEYPDGQHVILDDDDDEDEVGHSKEPRWVDELDEAYHTRHERHHHNYSEELREIEAAQEDSQEEDAVEVEDDDDVVEEEYDDEDVTGEHQADEDEEEVSPEELRRQRNEMNRQLRGQMGMSMGMGISNTARSGQRHPLGPIESVDLEDDEDDEIAEGVSDEEDPEGMGEYGNRQSGEVVEEEEEGLSDEEPFNDDEETHRGRAAPRKLYDDGASSEGEPEADIAFPQPHQNRASLSHHLQENLRHLESVMPPQERYDSPIDNVVMLLDSDEEEAEYPQDDSEAEDDDEEREELEYDGDSQDDQEGEYEQEHKDEYDQPTYTTQDDNTWKDDQDADPDKDNDVSGPNVAVVDSAVQIVDEAINRDEYADVHEQLRSFTSSTSSSDFGKPALFQSHVSDNLRLNLDTDQDDMDGGVARGVIQAGAHQSSPNAVQDEEMLSQPASPAEDYEVEQQSRYMDSGDGLGGHDTVVATDSPRLVDACNDTSLTDVVMTETPGYQGLSSAPEFASGTDTNIGQLRFEEDFHSAGIVVDEVEESKELQLLLETDSGADAGVSQIQIQIKQASTTTIPTSTIPVDRGAVLIDEPHTDAPLEQQEGQPVIDIEEEHEAEAFASPPSLPASARTPLLDRLHTIAQEENIDLQSPAQSTSSTSTELFSTPAFNPSGLMQPGQSADNPGSPTTFTTPNTSSTAAELERSDLSPAQPRRTRLTRMSTIAQTVRDGQAYMDQLAARSSPSNSKSNSASTADSHSTDSSSSSPSLKRASTGSSHGRTAANMVLLVKEAREFCAGGPSRVGLSPMDEEPARDMALNEEVGGQTVMAEDRVSSAGSQPSTPHKSGVVDLVAELVIQSKVKGHHALRVNPSSPGRSPVINASPSRSSSQEPSVISPMVPQHPLSQPPPPMGPTSSVFTFGQGSPSKSVPASPSVGFGFGTTFVTTLKERRTSVGSASSKTSPRKGSGLGSYAFALESEDSSITAVEPALPGVAEDEEVEEPNYRHDWEMKSAAVENLSAVEIESPGQAIEIEEEEEEEDDDDMAGGEASSSLTVGAEDESDSEDEDQEDEEKAGATTGAVAEGKGKKKSRKTNKGKKPAPKVQAKRLKRRELFWQKKQQEMQQLQQAPPQE
ncbi:hypothetical protein K457DRAFT_156013 [Linnemannia elongata AG-77]|uniref:Uncharacterized protein n=1 Tax=Linnemannia elongata AG-77 TaxID=1314771 RepID=A0A197JVA5_9FUNG|nr:hypothetical protein K457DRAFT_156013 [Linnemannia elongata AG-77]